MKILGAFTQDGFKGSIELLRFIRDIENDVLSALVKIIGSNTVFISGGEITEDSGNTTVTDGIILKDSKLYHFTGGTYSGAPSAQKVLFTEETAVGYPRPFFEGDPDPKDIYLDRTSKIDAAGTITLNTIVYINDLQLLKSKTDLVDEKADKNGFADITVSSGASISPGFTNYGGSSFHVYEYQDGTIEVFAILTFTGAKSIGTNILTGLPNSRAFLKAELCTIGISGVNTIGHITQTSGTIQVQDGFTASGSVNINFTYKKL